MLKIAYFHTNIHTQRRLRHLSPASLIDRLGEATCMMSMNWSNAWLMSGMVLSKVLSMC